MSLTPRQRREAREKRIAEGRANRLKKAHEAVALKKKQRDLIREKVKAGLPITQEEEALINWTANQSKKKKEDDIVDAAARLVIKPQHVSELRIIVERTAARHNYNPVEALIKLAASGDLEPKEQAAVHKALLPFLVPNLPTPKPEKEGAPDGGQVKVTITQFVFNEDAHQKPADAHHTDLPKTTATTPT